VHRPIGLGRFPTGLRPWIGSASPEVFRPYGACASGAPFCRDRRSRPRETRDAAPSPVPPTGFSQPLGGFSRDDLDEPELPRTRPGRRYARSFAALFHAANALGIPPSELSPLEEPCRLSAAFCSLAGSTSIRAPARKTRGSHERFPRGARPEPHARLPGGTREHDGRTVNRGSPERQAACPSCESPRTPTSATTPVDRARRLRTGSPASKPCSLRESVRARIVPSIELAPDLEHGPRAVALLGLCPFEACSTTTSGPVDREEAKRAEARPTPPEDHACSGRQSAALRS